MRHHHPIILGPTILAAIGILSLALLFAPAAFSQRAPASAAVSHARVVRLSFLQGTVSIRRPGSTDWTTATVNTPIQEGFYLATDKGSFAEVEFENGSTVRIGESSFVEFTQLALSPQGGHLNRVTLDHGYATFKVVPQRNDIFLVSALGVDVTPHGKAEFRTDLDNDHMRVEVLSGEVKAADASQTETVTKNHALIRDAGATASFQEIDKIKKDDWDKWTGAREQESSLAYDDEAVSLARPIYGWDDLDAYGEWGYFPGYGNAWAPYEPVGWSPYASGAWGWYSGMGYTWISGEPWGWLPFHYGFWDFDPAFGWFWMPGQMAAWSPALVNWYSGPGWIGWVPIGSGGIGGRLPCTLAVAGCLTAVPPTVVSGGAPIKSGSTSLVHPTSVESITPINRPNVAPSRSASATSQPFVGRPLGGQTGAQVASGGASAPATTFAAPAFERGHGSAPSSVIMGRVVSPETFLGQHSGDRQPIHVRLGSTIGGHVATSASAGAAGRSAIVGGGGGKGAPSAPAGPQILSHGSSGSGGLSRAGGIGTGGGASGIGRSGGGSSAASSGGGAASHASAAPSGGSSGGAVHH